MTEVGIDREIIVPIKKALLSVSNKDGIIEFGQFLHESGVQIISTGGTAARLSQAGIPVTLIESWTGSPECFDGRVKTLVPKVYGGLLYKRDDRQHVIDAEKLGFESIDLVVCNLYPFSDHVEKKSSDADLIENIDIGGPSMIRAAAKNYTHVTICTNSSHYKAVANAMMENSGMIGLSLRRQLAVDAFQLTARYDEAIFSELRLRFLNERDLNDGAPNDSALSQGSINRVESLPRIDGYAPPQELRYGENPHQRGLLCKAVMSKSRHQSGVANGAILQGKELSWNNLLDADGAWRLASDLALLAADKGLSLDKFNGQAGVAIIKHGNPCGASLGGDGLCALKSAWNQDAISAFGSVIASTVEIDAEMAAWLSDKFCEVILAPSYASSALSIFARKKSLRLMQLDLLQPSQEWVARGISGGLLFQQEDVGLDPEAVCATANKKINEQLGLAKFGVVLAKHLKSNAIALVAQTKNGFELIGAGMGQPNRVDSFVRLAFPRAVSNMDRLGIKSGDLLLASDAFFPFPDTVEAAAEKGIRNVVQPGGSVRDDEVIAACNRLNISMLMTGRRHFRH